MKMKGGNMGNMNKLLKQAQKMQADMARVQEEVAQIEIEGSAGGDMVVAKVNGANELLSLRIDPEAVDPEDVETLEDLVMAAVNSAMQQAKAKSEEMMGQVAGGMGGMPGMGGMGGMGGMPGMM